MHRQRTAKELKLEPALVVGQERRGPLFFLWEDSPFVGAQCSSCHAVVWVDSTIDPILAEPKPEDTPDSGSEYRNYYQGKIARFLQSQATCPSCKGSNFDRFINNVEFPRFQDGTSFDYSQKPKLIPLEPAEVIVWERAGCDI